MLRTSIILLLLLYSTLVTINMYLHVFATTVRAEIYNNYRKDGRIYIFSQDHPDDEKFY